MKRAIAAFIVTTALVSPANGALGTDGWDYGAEIGQRQWRSAAVVWAKSIHPDSPIAPEVYNELPPPREMWCLSSDPWDEYCDAWEHSMRQWLSHFLDEPYDADFTGLPAFPKECSSSCNLF